MVLDEASGLFQDDADTLDALDMFVRGFTSPKELAERLEFLKTVAMENAERRVRGACAPDDSLARPGTWDGSTEGDDAEEGPWEAA